MSIPYRHRRILRRVGIVAMVCLLAFLVVWLCWVVWLQRYVVYTSSGAKLDFNQSSYEISGVEAAPAKNNVEVSIFYNEGADAIDTAKEMTQLSGYYITSDMYKEDLDNVMLQVERLPSSTPIMVDMKGPFGTFFYNSKLSEAITSQSTNIQGVSQLLDRINKKGFYKIARISAFRDRTFGENHVSSGLYMLSRAGLWMDEGGMYWLDPTNATTITWISSVVLELKEMGFDEVLLDNFRFPVSEQYIFSGDKTEALQSAAKKIVEACASSKFVVSFGVDDPTFQLPDERCRIYLNNVDAGSVSSKVSQVTFDDPEIRLVFLSETGDTRYDKYSVMRSLNVAEEVENRKEN